MGNRKQIGAVIVEGVLDNMRAGAERLYYTVQVPTVYRVYLHRSDYEKLLPVEGKFIAEAKRALDEELVSQNRRGLDDQRGLLNHISRIVRAIRRLFGGRAGSAGAALRYEKSCDWQINLYRDTANDLKAGDVVIESELALATGVEAGGGFITKTTRTVFLDGVTKSCEVRTAPAAREPEDEEETKPQSQPGERVAPAGTGALALISYKDVRGHRHDYLMRKEKINVGKGYKPDTNPGYQIDLAVAPEPDISSLHLQLSFDPASRKFFIKDLSATGTRVNGRLVKSSVGQKDGKTVDLNVTEELPTDARISLSNKILLDFKSLLTN